MVHARTRHGLLGFCVGALAVLQLVACDRKRDAVLSEKIAANVGGDDAASLIVNATNGGSARLRAQTGTSATAIFGSARASGVVGIGNVYTFGPDGPVPNLTLTIAVGPDEQVDLTSAKICVLQGSTWKPLPDSQTDGATRTVTATVTHFSTYAVVSSSPQVGGNGTVFQAGGVTLSLEQNALLSMLALPGLVHLFVHDSPPQTLYFSGLAPFTRYFVYTRRYSSEAQVVDTDALGGLFIAFNGDVALDIRIQPDHGTITLPAGCVAPHGRSNSQKTACELVAPVNGVVIDENAPKGYLLTCTGSGEISGVRSAAGARIGVGLILGGSGASVVGCHISTFATGIEIPYSAMGADMTGAPSVTAAIISDVDVGIEILSNNATIDTSGVSPERTDSGLVGAWYLQHLTIRSYSLALSLHDIAPRIPHNDRRGGIGDGRADRV